MESGPITTYCRHGIPHMYVCLKCADEMKMGDPGGITMGITELQTSEFFHGAQWGFVIGAGFASIVVNFIYYMRDAGIW